MQMKDALKIIEPKVAKIALVLAKKAVKHGKVPAVGRTHGQHASIISFGLKFANWAAEMSKHVERIEELKKRILICKTLGVVGTGKATRTISCRSYNAGNSKRTLCRICI
jgi:adenylosuccinate lyase